MVALLLALSLSAAPLPIETSEDAARLCAALAPPGRAGGLGEAARAAALAGRYEVSVAAGGVRFQAWDPGEQRLSLDPAAFLAAAGGALRVWAPAAAGGMSVIASRSTLDRILAAREAGRLSLGVTFALRAEPGDTPCAHVPGARAATLEIAPLAWEWRDGDEPLAGGALESDRPAFSVTEGARPRVTVAPDAAGAAARLQARAASLERCYRAALSRRPDLDGALVLELTPEAAPRVAADSVQDEELAACVRRAASDLRSEALALVPVHFDLEAPATAQAR
ncbi:MAG TPA: hypothetical protein VFE30_02970 [Anaeromyxobacteraceae bacterium]|jgi:hypothetical protein|nr:hypothetical protein [Anaeromyxobacteraceae bacterium]